MQNVRASFPGEIGKIYRFHNGGGGPRQFEYRLENVTACTLICFCRDEGRCRYLFNRYRYFWDKKKLTIRSRVLSLVSDKR